MNQDPINLLRKMERDSLANSPGLPEEVQAVELWSGVGFRVGNIHLVTPLDQVSEVLSYPNVTSVPRTKSWVKGVANIRGNLVTVVDLSRHFGKEPVFVDDRARVMVLGSQELRAGVLVSEVYGLRHFDEEMEKQKLTGVDDPIMSMASMAFLRDSVLWGVVDLLQIAQRPAFMHVAA